MSAILRSIELLTDGFINKDCELESIWYEILMLSGRKRCSYECECVICDLSFTDQLIASVFVGVQLDVYISAGREQPNVVSVIVNGQYAIDKYVKDSWFDDGEIYIYEL